MVIMYHNVVTNDAPAGCLRTSITLKEKDFFKQLNWLKSEFNMLSADEYIDKQESAKLKSDDILLTFDDGTEMTYDLIAPVLKKEKIPAMIFVSTCQLEGGELIWGGSLNAICLEDTYPEIEIEGTRFFLKNTEEKVKARAIIVQMARESGDPIGFVKQLAQRYPIALQLQRYYRGMAYSQLKDAGASQIITIASHTVHHPDLSVLGLDAQRKEICDSRSTLEIMSGQAVKYFSYPSGDYNSDTLDILISERFDAAFAVAPKHIGSDPLFEIPRTGIFSASMLKLKYKMGGWKGIFTCKKSYDTSMEIY